jgi:signal transduction histidine kinase
VNLTELRKSPLFDGLSDAELQLLLDQAEPVSLRAGEVLMKQGESGDAAYVVLKGEFEIRKQAGQSVIKIDVRNPGEVVGEMALLARAPRSATVTSITAGDVLRIPIHVFDHLLSTSPTAALAVLHWVMARLSQNEALLHQQEKAAALGTLSAGLAHELNNPAAAAQRSVSQLSETLPKWLDLTHQIETLAFEQRQTAWFENFMHQASQRFASPAKLDALQRIDLVDELQTSLENFGLEAAWELAPGLVSFGWDVRALDALKSELQGSPPLFSLAIRWLGAGCQVHALLAEVQQTAGRISQIVRAMKSYTYLDQAPILEVDVHEGLENTLVIMQHKLNKGVSVKREYAAHLPRIEAYASELNQVWTNIIDNAVDALDGKGELILRTYEQDDRVVVEIADNGPGIPEDIRTRIFEPFFTTKAPGRGTGLGLHISHDIIANRHHGQLLVESRPGETRFRAILPKRIKGQGEHEQ